MTLHTDVLDEQSRELHSIQFNNTKEDHAAVWFERMNKFE